MRAAFYGGPADGGELLLTEPIRVGFRFPVTADAAAELLAPRQNIPGGGAWIAHMAMPAEYRVHLDADNRVVRDRQNRVRLVYVVPKTTPTEGKTDD